MKMDNIKSSCKKLIENIYLNGIQNLLEEYDSAIYVKDPVFKIIRNRITAECLQAMIYSGLGSKEIYSKMCRFLQMQQKKDGCWYEIHPNYNQPSALVTSFVGDALITAHDKADIKNVKENIYLAKDYVLASEKSPGFFLKSAKNHADHLNVDASCGAFLANFGKLFDDEDCLNAAERAARHVSDFQWKNGVFPYTIDKGNYQYIFNIPCIHYQSVTLFYLLKIYEVLKKDWLKKSLKNGAKWLQNTQKDDGRFDWSKSGLILSYYLSGAYAFSFSVLMYFTKWENKYKNNARLCLNVLNRNIDGLVLRWEKSQWRTLPLSIPITLKTALIGEFPLKHKLFRFGYGAYRQYAIRGLSDSPSEDLIFQKLTKFLKIDYTVIEASKNFHDLFMTSEVVDCLSQSLLWSE
jgi:hypothetical protein